MTKSKLKAVDPKSAEPSKPKILIYGKPGVGKTWGSLDFPSVYYIDTEGGANLPHYTDKLKKSGGVYFGPDQGSLDYENIIEQIKALATEDHPYKTLVIDSVSKVFNNEIARENERLKIANKSSEFAADRKPAVGFTKRLVSWLERVDMTVILVTHEKAEWGLDENKKRVEIGTTFDCWDKLEYELHLCLNIIKAGDRRIAKIRKTRLQNFPDGSTFPWSYQEFSERYGKEVIERSAVKIELATPEQLKELKDLLEVVKIPDTQIEKWLTAANTQNFEEMDSEKVSKIITFVKGKVANNAV
jgi:hypothetical protein